MQRLLPLASSYIKESESKNSASFIGIVRPQKFPPTVRTTYLSSSCDFVNFSIIVFSTPRCQHDVKLWQLYSLPTVGFFLNAPTCIKRRNHWQTTFKKYNYLILIKIDTLTENKTYRRLLQCVTLVLPWTMTESLWTNRVPAKLLLKSSSRWNPSLKQVHNWCPPCSNQGSLNSQKAWSRTLITYHRPAQTSLA